MSLLLDTGALIAFEKGSRVVRAFLECAWRNRESVQTSTAVVAQVWRDGARQVGLSRLLRGVEELDLNARRARDVGLLLGLSRTVDIVDAAIIELAKDGDEILTSDPEDLARLAERSGKTLIVTSVT